MPSHTRPTTYVPGSFLRPCDVCGIRFLSDQLVRGADGKFRCRRWCTEITNLEVDKLKAQSHKRKESPPPPHATPWVRGDLAAEEGPLFQWLAEKEAVDANGVRNGVAPEEFWSVEGAGGPLSGYSLASGMWTCIYLGAVVAEARRPTSWMVSAKAKLRKLGDWILSLQLGPTGTGDNYLVSTEAAWYGGWFRINSPFIYAEDVGAGCLALTRAYQATSDSRYLEGARRAALCINRMQNGDKLTQYPASSDADGLVPWHAGMPAHVMALTQAEG